MMASLDHVMWFHREFRADEWLLFHLHSPSAMGARGFARGLGVPRRRPARDEHRPRGPDPPDAVARVGRDAQGSAMASPSGVIDLRSDTVTHAHARDAPGDGRRRGRRRRLPRGPDRQPPRVAGRGAPRQGSRALRAVGHHGQPARAPAARPPGHRGAVRRARARLPVRERVVGGERARAAAPAPRRRRPCSRPTRSPRAARRSIITSPRSPRSTIENTHMPACGRPWRVDRGRRGGRCRERARVRVALRRRAHLERGRSRSTSRRASSSRACRHGDVLPVEGARGAGRIAAVRRARRDRRGPRAIVRGSVAACARPASSPPRGSWRWRRWSTACATTTHARAALAVALAERFPGASIPSTCETNIVCAPADRLPREILPVLAAAGIRAGTIDADTVRFVTHKDVDDADIARRSPSSTSSPTRTVTRGADRTLAAWPTTFPRVRSRSTRTPTTPRSRPAARSRAGPTRARRSGR